MNKSSALIIAMANQASHPAIRLMLTLRRGAAKVAGGLLVAALAAGQVRADDPACPGCERVTGGSVIAYYFGADGKLVAGEKVEDSRLIKPSTKSGMELLLKGACVAMPSPPENQETMQVGGGVSATAVYVQTAGNPSQAMDVLGVEDMAKVTDRQIAPIRPTDGVGICRCNLVWCGRVKCCPCP